MLFPEFSISPSGSYRGDSMIYIFDVPPLARGEGLCDIDTEVFSPEKFRKMSKNGNSWHDGIGPIIRVFPFDL